MAVQTHITLSDDLLRNVQTGSVKINGDVLSFNEVVARHTAPFQMGDNNFRRGMCLVVVTKEELSAVRIPLNAETKNEYTVDKYNDLEEVLMDVTESE